jgi:hypothetical protein
MSLETKGKVQERATPQETSSIATVVRNREAEKVLCSTEDLGIAFAGLGK